jgi:hypothetical protein
MARIAWSVMTRNEVYRPQGGVAAKSDFDTLIRNNVYYQQLTARRKSLGTTSTTLSGFA